MNLLKGTWEFKLKRLPDGTPSNIRLLSALEETYNKKEWIF
jgi:hypothetical protein